ncbi:hypothetical protein [Bradyrhizobium sp. Leo121]|uniref:hypothetical protein n=1 Tax=Bradyrhizobium sp. Leo121 TaxID=1571195 RepID=UPI001029E3F3|nr:hypothetical protein [Bradyrhizobium sp. Leo121]
MANNLRARGQNLVALDHDALVAHADQFLEISPRMRRALTMLRNYREPDVSAHRGPRRHTFSQDDKRVIERATHAAVEKGRSLTAVDRYCRSLRRFSEVLNRNGEGISTLDHGSLIARAKGLFPDDGALIDGLKMIRDSYSSAPEAASQAIGVRQPDDRAVQSAGSRDDSEETPRDYWKRV